MTEDELLQIAIEMDPELPAAQEGCFNRPPDPLHERRGGPSAHQPSNVGRTTWLVANAGYPESFQEWVGYYFGSGASFDQLSAGEQANPNVQLSHGRSPAALLVLVHRLTAFARTQPEAARGCDFSERAVAEWFLHLVLVRPWTGARGERAVLKTLNQEAPTWHTTDCVTDIQLQIDLAHDRSAIGVQVKPHGWSQKPGYLKKWLTKSASWPGHRWLVEYTDELEIGAVFRVGADGGLGASDLGGLIEAARGAT